MQATKIDAETFLKLWNKGMSVPAISKVMGVNIDTLYKYAHRHKFSKRKAGHISLLDADPEKKKWFIRNYPEMSNSTISVYLGLSPYHIGYIARQLGLKKSSEYWEGIKDYHRKKMKAFHESKKGDKSYYKYTERPRLNGKFIKRQEE